DAQNFKKFQNDYWKYASKNINMAFFITFISSSLKRKINPDDDNPEYDTIIDPKNKNCIPKVSSLSSTESLIAKNVLEILSSLLPLQQPNLIQQPNFLQQSIFPGQLYFPPSFYNSFTLYFLSLIYGMPFHMPIQSSFQSTSRTILSTMEDFLNHVDECKDENFEKCDVDTIGTKQTLREYAARYNIAFTPPYNT
ncbi:6877_t:CDS:2, partial [Gigaspora margarita]